MSDKPIMTTTGGNPVADNQNSLSAGPRGPLLLQDFHLIEKLAHQNRERIPERVVHAKGWGAFGTLTVTHDITRYTKAALFGAIGKQTPMLARFSTVAGELGAADAERDVRGFALKFYTEEGNWDMVGNNTPVFFVRDPLKFPDFIHTQKRHPKTNLRSPKAMWDFWSLSPESLHQVTILFSDRGLPPSPRFMNGYGSHTYSFINAAQERFWVKFHFKTHQGHKFLTNSEAAEVVGCVDVDAHARVGDRDLEDAGRIGADDDACAQLVRRREQLVPHARGEQHRVSAPPAVRRDDDRQGIHRGAGADGGPRGDEVRDGRGCHRGVIDQRHESRVRTRRARAQRGERHLER